MIVYILLCVLVGGYAVSSLYNRQQTIAAMLTLVLIVLVFTFYGLRWFQGGALKGTEAKKGEWPPIVNMCPDFMITYKKDNNIYCYDVNNTYNARANTSPSAPYTTLGTVGGIQNSQGLMIRNASATSTATRLKEDADSSSPKWPLLKTLKTSAQDVIGSASAPGKWIRWEGVWDGRNLKPESAPLP